MLVNYVQPRLCSEYYCCKNTQSFSNHLTTPEVITQLMFYDVVSQLQTSLSYFGA
ncbi:hypothetical protein SAMN04488493_1153 [Xylanibacter ruminicola]|nr:hypothetical protein SAMN04488493_1153 [Xylanibacter ruminicola]